VGAGLSCAVCRDVASAVTDDRVAWGTGAVAAEAEQPRGGGAMGVELGQPRDGGKAAGAEGEAGGDRAGVQGEVRVGREYGTTDHGPTDY
jgi:hypothetical protein